MLFRFKGDYTGKRTSITLFGVTFEGREPADVTDEDGIRRLSNHPEFEAVSKAVAPAAEIEAREAWVEKLEDGLLELAANKITAGKKRGRPRKGS